MQRRIWFSAFLFSTALFCSSSLLGQSSLIIACKYDSTGAFHYGAYSETGALVYPFEYTSFWGHQWGLWIAGIGNGYLVFDANGERFIDDTLESVRLELDMSNRFAALLGGKWGFYDKAGRLAIKYQFDDVSDFYKGYAKCVLKGDTIAIDTNGRKVSLRNVRDPDHYLLGSFASMSDIPAFESDSLIVRKEGDLVGLVDKQGSWRVPPIYQSFEENIDGKIFARKNDLWGVIDHQGNEIIPFEHNSLRIE